MIGNVSSLTIRGLVGVCGHYGIRVPCIDNNTRKAICFDQSRERSGTAFFGIPRGCISKGLQPPTRLGSKAFTWNFQGFNEFQDSRRKGTFHISADETIMSHLQLEGLTRQSNVFQHFRASDSQSLFPLDPKTMCHTAFRRNPA